MALASKKHLERIFRELRKKSEKRSRHSEARHKRIRDSIHMANKQLGKKSTIFSNPFLKSLGHEINPPTTAAKIADSLGVLKIKFNKEQTAIGFGTFLIALDDLQAGYTIFKLDLPVQATPSESLSIQVLHINSPGLLELLGKYNPLKFIYDLTKLGLKHLSERRAHKITEETRKIQNRGLLCKVVEKEIELMKTAGFSKTDIRKVVAFELGLKTDVYLQAAERVGIIDIDCETVDKRLIKDRKVLPDSTPENPPPPSP
jgi:hypothetical protein